MVQHQFAEVRETASLRVALGALAEPRALQQVAASYPDESQAAIGGELLIGIGISD
jgi:hypothetical protein